MKYNKGLKKWITLLLAMVIVMSIFAGCNSQKDTDSSATTSVVSSTQVEESKETVYPENGLSKNEKVTINVAWWEAGAGREYYDLAVANFTKKYPNVTFETTSSPTISEVVKTKIASNDDASMFDMLSYNWQDLAKDGLAEPLEDVLDRTLEDAGGKTVKEMILPGLMDTLTYFTDKHLYYLPHATYTAGLFFDQNFFDENGWNKDPKTWDEFLELCESIKAKGIIPITTAGVYGYEMFAFQPKQYEIAEMNGNKDFVKNNRSYRMPFYASPENTERWNREYQLGQLGYIDSNSVSKNHTQSQMDAIQHKAAMVISGDWIEKEMQDSTPEGFKWGFMAVPFTTDPSQTIYISSGMNSPYSVYKNRPELNKKWAKEFLYYLYTLEAQQLIVEKGGALSVRIDYKDDPARMENLRNSQKSVMEYLKNHKTSFIDVNSYDIALTDPNYGKATKLYSDSVALMAVGKKDPADVLKKADEMLKPAVDAYDKENK